MSETTVNKMLVCDALDERDFLRKKIISAIKSAKFVDSKRKKDTKIQGIYTDEEFKTNAERTFQSIKDLISRYQKIDVAITMSNAETVIKTRSGKEMTVAAAIALRKSLRGDSAVDTDFTGLLIEVMRTQYNTAVTNVATYDRKANAELETYKSNFVGSDRNKQLSTEEVTAIEKLVENLYGELIDPIGVRDELKKLEEEHFTLVKELDTAIKVSNASTYIELD